MAVGLIGGGQNGVRSGVVVGSDNWSWVYVANDARPVDVLPSPTPAPLAEALPVLEPYTPSPTSIEGIICSFDWDCDYWIAVATCESGLRASANGYKGGYIGLFQVWLAHGYGYDWLLDPYNNTLAAWELSRGGTYTAPWPSCRWIR